MEGKVEIKLNKVKLWFFLVSAVIFIVIGCLGAMDPEKFVSALFRSPAIIRIFGVAGICFFGFGIIFIARKIFDSRPGLIIDEIGITNNTNVVNMGLIEWQDISKIKIIELVANKIIILHTNNPKKYINRESNLFVRRAMNMSLKAYGSPISITSNSLKINADELAGLVTEEFEKHKLKRVNKAKARNK